MDQELRFEAIEHIESGSGNKNELKTTEDMVLNLSKDDETQAAAAFNSGIVRQRVTSSQMDGNLNMMASTIAANSSSAEGWLTFISASARGSLPSIATVKPKRILPFIWVEKTSSLGEIVEDEENKAQDSEQEDDNNTVILSTTNNNVSRLIPKPTKLFENAARSVKSAAVQALERVKDNIFQRPANDPAYDPGDSTLHERFGSLHIVYPSDVEYYKNHESVEAMVTTFEADVLQYEQEIEPNGKGFEWYISRDLSSAEIALRDKVMAERADSAVTMVEM